MGRSWTFGQRRRSKCSRSRELLGTNFESVYSHTRVGEALRQFIKLLLLIKPRVLLVQSDKPTTLFHSGAFVTIAAQDEYEAQGDRDEDEAEIGLWKDVADGNFIKSMVSRISASQRSIS